MDENESDDWELIPHEPDSRLPEEMRKSLLKSATRVRSHQPEEMEMIYHWANHVLVAAALLSEVEKGHLLVQVLDGKVKFSPAGPRNPQSILRN